MSRFNGNHQQALGELGEVIAAHYLRAQGYEIVEACFRTRGGELDLVTFQENCLVFVEVKTRMDLDFGRPIEAMDQRKWGRVARVALERIRQYNWTGDWRIDFIGIVLAPDGGLQSLDHWQDIT